MYVAVAGADFGALLGGSLTPLEPQPLVSDFSGGALTASVASQAFTDEAGDCLFLYQIQDRSTGLRCRRPFYGQSVLRHHQPSFTGLPGRRRPAGFLSGDQAPLYAERQYRYQPEPSGSTSQVGNPIYGVPELFYTPGKSSMVLYVDL